MRLLEHVRDDRNEGLLFQGASGRQYSAHTPTQALDRILGNERGSKHGEEFTPHALRHAYNTRMRQILRDAGSEGLWDGDSMTAQVGRHSDNILRAFTGHKIAAMTAHYDHPDLDRALEFYEAHFRRYVERIWGD